MPSGRARARAVARFLSGGQLTVEAEPKYPPPSALHSVVSFTSVVSMKISRTLGNIASWHVEPQQGVDDDVNHRRDLGGLVDERIVRR